jgi:hypothetical protein
VYTRAVPTAALKVATLVLQMVDLLDYVMVVQMAGAMAVWRAARWVGETAYDLVA